MPPYTSATVPQRRSLDTISTWALLTTITAAVFVVLPFASVAFATTKTYLLAGGALTTLALYILARLTRGNIVFPSAVLFSALWLPTIAYALSSAFSGVPFVSAFWGTALEPDTLGFMLTAASLGTLSALVLRRPEHYQSFLRVGTFAFAGLALLQTLILVVGQVSPSTISPAFSLVGSFSDLASVLGLGVVATLITFRFLEVESRTRRVLLASSVVALFLLAIANSSIVWVLLALVSLGFFVESVMRRGSKSADSDLDEAVTLDEAPLEEEKGNRSLVLPLGVLAASLFFLIGSQLGGALGSALHVNVLNVRPSWQSTFTVAQKAYGSTSVFGSGPSTFGAEWLKFRDGALNSTVFWNVDFTSGIGFIPTSSVTTGIVGAVAWLAFLGLFLVLGLRMLIVRTPQDAFARYVAILSFVGSLYLFVIALFDIPNTVVLALAFVFAGLFVSTTRYASNGRQFGVLFSRSPRLGFVIVFALTLLLLASVVAAYTLVGRYVAAVSAATATEALKSGNLDKADSAVQNALSFAPSADLYQLQASIASARLTQIAGSSTMEKTAAQKAYQAALGAGINAALAATSQNPSDYQNWLMLGNLYAQAVPLGVTGSYESAKSAYEKARVLNPTNPQILYILAQLDIAHKDAKSAEDNLKAAISLKQDYTNAIFLLSQLLVQEGNVKDALSAALAAAYFAPNDPSVLFQVGILSAAAGDYPSAVSALSASVTANPQFANARYFLAAVYAKQGDLKSSLAQLQAIAAMSSENATAVASQITALTEGNNPFPANLLSASPTPIKQ